MNFISRPNQTKRGNGRQIRFAELYKANTTSRSGIWCKNLSVFLGLMILACICLGIITLRVNSQREASKWITDLGGNFTYQIERGDKNQ